MGYFAKPVDQYAPAQNCEKHPKLIPRLTDQMFQEAPPY